MAKGAWETHKLGWKSSITCHQLAGLGTTAVASEKLLGGHTQPCGVIGRLSWTVHAIPCANTAHGTWWASRKWHSLLLLGQVVEMLCTWCGRQSQSWGEQMGDRQLGTRRPGLMAGVAAMSPLSAPTEWELGELGRRQANAFGNEGLVRTSCRGPWPAPTPAPALARSHLS